MQTLVWSTVQGTETKEIWILPLQTLSQMQRFFFKPQIITIYTISINVKKEVLRKYNEFRKGSRVIQSMERMKKLGKAS